MRSSRRPGGRRQDVDAAAHRIDLRLVADAAEHHGLPQVHVAAVIAKALGDLDREFAGRRQDQGARHPRARGDAVVGEALQHRQGERGGLAGAGLRDAEEIAAFEEMGNGLRLDRRRHGVFLGLESALQGLDERKIGKGKGH